MAATLIDGNSDGAIDLAIRMPAADLQITDETVTVRGLTTSGRQVFGSDVVTPTACP